MGTKQLKYRLGVMKDIVCFQIRLKVFLYESKTFRLTYCYGLDAFLELVWRRRRLLFPTTKVCISHYHTVLYILALTTVSCHLTGSLITIHPPVGSILSPAEHIVLPKLGGIFHVSKFFTSQAISATRTTYRKGVTLILSPPSSNDKFKV